MTRRLLQMAAAAALLAAMASPAAAQQRHIDPMRGAPFTETTPPPPLHMGLYRA